MGLLKPLLTAAIICFVNANIRCDLTDKGEYSLKVGEAVLATGAPIAFFVENKWWSSSSNGTSGTLLNTKYSEVSGSDERGEYQGAGIEWVAGSTKVTTLVKNYHNFVTFAVVWPAGATGIQNDAMNRNHSVIQNFPAFVGLEKTTPGVVSWHNNFVLASVGRKTFGPAGGPTVFYNDSTSASSGIAFIASPLNWFKASSEDDATHSGTPAFVPGTSGTFESLPAGFNQTYIFYGGSGMGFTNVMSSWGSLMQKWHRTKKIKDITIETLSYQTDNGAQYCYCYSDCSNKLISTVNNLHKQKVPLGFVSYQGAWWNNPHIHEKGYAPWCVTNWGTNHTKYPIDVKQFSEDINLPLQLYAPYFCDDTTYAKQNGGQWDMMESSAELNGCSGTFMNAKPDVAKSFYDWFFTKYITEYGMIGYEPDFLQQNYECNPTFIHNVTASPTWQTAMATSALERGLPVQWCMATPTDLLMSLQFDSVTNFRGSSDYYYGSSWDVGVSSHLIWSLGSAPSKDTFWTDPRNVEVSGQLGGCSNNGCPADHLTPGGCEMHTLLTIMSTGPVGFSDADNLTDTELILRTVAASGLLLKPSKAATAVDSSLQADTSKQPEGYILGTYTGYGIDDVTEWYTFAHQMRADYDITWRDLHPSPKIGSTVYVRNWHMSSKLCSNGSSECVQKKTVVDLDEKFATFPKNSESDQFAPTLFVVSDISCSSGVVLLGDISKYSSASTVRYTNKKCTTNGMEVTLVGSPNEVVVTTFITSDGKSLSISSTVSAQGTATVSI
eukprot:TRINITY_DN3809_c0_g1_i3.p1 TRINITY_DN3809_c0_g1~~TRINITY_DN3809_c0_g1_i3.p1  ORF type:complete len:799 (+),score=172.91 TRINITY_DN3809_c0_g1_i3:63-2399(+)